MSSAGFIPAELASHTVEGLYAEHGSQRTWTYWLILTGVIGAFASLPLIKVDVSVRAAGMVRPSTERAELRPAVSGHIAEVLASDHMRVEAGQVLLVLGSRDLEERRLRIHALQQAHIDLIFDLQLLTSGPVADDSVLSGGGSKKGDASEMWRRSFSVRGGPGVSLLFRTEALRQESYQLIAQLEAYRLAESKAGTELDRCTSLANKGIATRQEVDNANFDLERLRAESRLLVEQNLARWQARLRDARTTLAGLESEALRLREEQTQYMLRAPVAGVLVGFSGWSVGGFIAAGQSLGAVSPEDTLQVETYVSPRDIGLVREGQVVRLQVDAYPYTQWGTLDGTVAAISGDLVGGVAPSLANGNSSATSAGFKVLVRPAATYLALPGGVRGELRKGLTLSARFLVARRSLLQILYQDVSAWLDPGGNRPALG
ncbi:MAG: HlyD family efflux transporter periplasmic adaptor subunit [Candidatus Didemnitutus sp.]|nr:HlyD family efflux transporter periplasmic adaptor subunit [Candidatus Didemnitutus sp.]